MEIPSLGCGERTTLVVLGAGATRGAQFAEAARIGPPLDRDFFRVLQMSSTGRSEAGARLLDHVRATYGPALDIGMETVFSNLDAARTFHNELKVDRGPRVQWPSRLIEDLNAVLPNLLGETADQSCPYHDQLASSLGTLDAIISLNYDCVMDRALRAASGRRFAPERGGYGVAVEAGAELWASSGRGKAPAGSIRLLKLHGSVNWESSGSALRLRPDDALSDPVAPGVIQPPLTRKTVTTEPFRSIWKQARRAVRQMRRLVIVGYSLPDADGLVRTLLTTDLPELLEVLVVEPNPSVQSSHIDLFTRRAPAVKVFAFSSLLELSEALAE